jgi:hypothetical protein
MGRRPILDGLPTLRLVTRATVKATQGFAATQSGNFRL